MNAVPLSLSVVIPAYNEERRLPASLEALTSFLGRHDWAWDVRVVDDGSSDATARVVRQAAAREPRVVLQREPHRGKGGALKAGLLAAGGDYRFICDADLSMPPHELPRFLPPLLDRFDVAIGSREGVGARRVGEPALRHLVGRVFNGAIRALVLGGLADTQCGFKMFTAAAVGQIFPFVTLDGWAFDVEVLCIARRQGLRVVEVPIEWHHRPASQVSVVRDSIAMLRDVLYVRSRLRRGLLGRAQPSTPARHRMPQD